MAELKTLERLRQNRIEKMRLGQRAFEVQTLVSDPEVRVALIPLLEKDYYECQMAVAELGVPENVAGAAIMDRHERREILTRSIRDVDSLEQRLFKDVEDMMGMLEPVDINKLYDVYVEMATEFSPHIGQLGDEEIDFLKELFGNYQWSDMSGKQLFALNRFLLTLPEARLLDNLLGSSLTN